MEEKGVLTPEMTGGILQTYGVTHAGKVSTKQVNEDSLEARFFPRQGALLVVADGMGGLESGDQASRRAVAEIMDTFSQLAEQRVSPEEALRRAIDQANLALYREFPVAGSTCVCALVSGDRLIVAHLGDSRAYLFRKSLGLQRLTRDHNWQEDTAEGREFLRHLKQGEHLPIMEREAQDKAGKLTRRLGKEPTAQVEIGEERLQVGDLVLLCSDGLSRELSDATIAEFLRSDQPLALKARGLVNEAVRLGGRDNVTVLLAEVLGVDFERPATPVYAVDETTEAIPPILPTPEERRRAEAEARRRRLQQDLESGRYEVVETLLEGEQGSRLRQLLTEAKAQIEKRNYKGEIKCLEQAQRILDGLSEEWSEIVREYIRRERYKLWYRCAQMLKAKGKTEQARKALERALEEGRYLRGNQDPLGAAELLANLPQEEAPKTDFPVGPREGPILAEKQPQLPPLRLPAGTGKILAVLGVLAVVILTVWGIRWLASGPQRSTSARPSPWPTQYKATALPIPTPQPISTLAPPSPPSDPAPYYGYLLYRIPAGLPPALSEILPQVFGFDDRSWDVYTELQRLIFLPGSEIKDINSFSYGQALPVHPYRPTLFFLGEIKVETNRILVATADAQYIVDFPSLVIERLPSVRWVRVLGEASLEQPDEDRLASEDGKNLLKGLLVYKYKEDGQWELLWESKDLSPGQRWIYGINTPDGLGGLAPWARQTCGLGQRILVLARWDMASHQFVAEDEQTYCWNDEQQYYLQPQP